MAHDEWDDIEAPEGGNEDEELNEEPIDETSAKSSGKYDKLLSSDSRKYKLSGMFKDWFLDYSSYVILQRAVPHIVDGLKPVQRRVLHAMFRMDDGSYTKVANIVGQAMQYHPHGDASILGALVQLGQHLVHRELRGLLELAHQRQAPVGGNHHLEGPGLPVAPRVLARVVDVEAVVRMFDDRHPQPTPAQAGDELLHQRGFAGPGEPGKAGDLHHALLER